MFYYTFSDQIVLGYYHTKSKVYFGPSSSRETYDLQPSNWQNLMQIVIKITWRLLISYFIILFFIRFCLTSLGTISYKINTIQSAGTMQSEGRAISFHLCLAISEKFVWLVGAG